MFKAFVSVAMICSMFFFSTDQRSFHVLDRKERGLSARPCFRQKKVFRSQPDHSSTGGRHSGSFDGNDFCSQNQHRETHCKKTLTQTIFVDIWIQAKNYSQTQNMAVKYEYEVIFSLKFFFLLIKTRNIGTPLATNL